MRLFAALVPPHDVVDALDEFLAPRRETDPSVRWAVPEQWHLTLAFCAHAPDRSYDELCERLTRAARRRTPFDLELAGAGAFPNPASAKVLYLGTRTPEEQADVELQRLATGARAAFSKAGCAVEGSRFTPHVTMARLRRPVDVTRWLRVLDTFSSGEFRVDEISLIESHLGEGPRNRPRYEVRERFSLGRAALHAD